MKRFSRKRIVIAIFWIIAACGVVAAAAPVIAAAGKSDLGYSSQTLEIMNRLGAAVEKAWADAGVSRERAPAYYSTQKLPDDLVKPYQQAFPAIAEARRKAVEDLAALGPQAVPALLKGKDESLDPQDNIFAKALIKIGSPAVPEIIAYYWANRNAPQTELFRMAQTLGGIGDPRALDTLLAILQASESWVTVEAAKSVGQFKSERAVEPLLARWEFMASRENMADRAIIAESLGKIGDRRAVPLIVHEVNWYTAVIARLGPNSDFDSYGWELERFISALEALGDPRAVPALQNLLRTLRSRSEKYNTKSLSECIQHVEEALRKLGAATSTAPEQMPGGKISDEETSGSGQTAVQVLDPHQNPARLPILFQQLKDPEPKTRFFALDDVAVFTRPDFHCPQATDKLLESTRDPEPWVREHALDLCIIQLKDPRLRDCLITSLKDENADMRRMAIKGLSRLPGPQTAQSLLKQYKRESDPWTKRMILAALPEAGAADEFAQIIRAMSIKEKLDLANQDMKLVISSINAFVCDWSGSLAPDQVFIPGSVYAQRYGTDAEVLRLWEQVPRLKKMDLCLGTNETFGAWLTEAEYGLITCVEARLASQGGMAKGTFFELEKYRAYHLERLTTPMAYVSTVPKDPFGNPLGRPYRFGTIIDKKKLNIFEYPPLVISNGPDGRVDVRPELLELGPDGKLFQYSEYPFKGEPRPISDFIYDPTNGSLSSGDIVQSWPGGIPE